MRQEIGVSLLLLAGTLAPLAGCERDAEPGTERQRERAAEIRPVGPYAVAGDALYRREDGTLVAVAVLPGAEAAAPDTLEECVAEIPDLGKAHFGRLDLAPDTAWAAWATTGPGACVGVLSPGEPGVRVLGRWLAAYPDTLLWAPAGHYLAIGLARAGRRDLEVYDAMAGRRLQMPWEFECGYEGDCDVTSATWLGGTLLNVEIRLGPAEPPVPFEVNVAAAAPATPEEEV